MVSGTREHAEALREEIAGVLAADGPAPVGGKDADHPHRRGPRLPRLAHPAPPQARHQPALRLHLPVHARPSRPSRPRSRRMCRTEPTSRSKTCCASSTRRCGAGAPTSGPGCPAATFDYLTRYTWARVMRWMRRKHRQITWKEHPPPLLRRRMVAGHATEIGLFNPARCAPRATATGAQPSRRPWPASG